MVTPPPGNWQLSVTKMLGDQLWTECFRVNNKSEHGGDYVYTCKRFDARINEMDKTVSLGLGPSGFGIFDLSSRPCGRRRNFQFPSTNTLP